jgi:hypothetical protein
MASMLGKATYLTEDSEESWANFVRDMNDWFEKHKTIPVNPEGLFPEAAELLSERGMDWDDINTIYKDRNIKKRSSGQFVDYVPEQDHLGTKGVHSYRGSEPAFLSITEEGETAYDESKSAPRIHEYFHYLDKVMDMGGSGIAKRMAEYGDDLSSEEMLEAWMNDKETEHLDLDNPENKGLRTLLKNRLHHEGVVNVREDIGRFLSTMLNDEQYSKWLNKDFVVKNKGYYSNPSEMLSYAAQPMVKETDRDKAYKKVKWYFGTDWKIDDLDKGLADSIATYANARYLENKGWM